MAAVVPVLKKQRLGSGTNKQSDEELGEGDASSPHNKKTKRRTITESLAHWMNPSKKPEVSKYAVSKKRNNSDQYTDSELAAAIKIGKFANVRRKLKEIAHKHQRIQRYVRAMVFFAVFLGVFMYNNMYSDEDQFFVVDQVRKTFASEETFSSVETVADVWGWFEGVLVNEYYTSSTWDGRPFEAGSDEQRWILGSLRKVGGIRVGTLRARRQPCSLHTLMFNETDLRRFWCHGLGEKLLWDASIENKTAYGEGGSLFVWEGWNGTSTSYERSQLFTEQTTYPADQRYDSPAFSVVLPQTNQARAAATISYLKENGYIDRASRWLVVDTSFFSGQLDLLIVVRFMFSLTKAGGVIPSFEIAPVRTNAIPFLQYNIADGESSFASIMHIIEVLFYLYFYCLFAYELYTFRCHRLPADEVDGEDPLEETSSRCWGRVKKSLGSLLSRFANFWQGLVDEPPAFWQLVNLTFYGFTWFFRLAANSYMARGLTMTSDSYANIRSYSELLFYHRYTLAVTAFAVGMRVMYFMAIVPSLAIITTTLSASARAIGGFLIILLIDLVTFVVIFMSIFSGKVMGFRDYTSTFYSLFLMLSGEFDFDELRGADRLVGGFVFLAFVIINTIVFLNMAIAIISEAYLKSQEELESSVDVKIGREIYRYFLTRIWGIPFLGPRLKHWYIHRGSKIARKRSDSRIRRADSSAALRLQLKEQLKNRQAAEKARLAQPSIRSIGAGSYRGSALTGSYSATSGVPVLTGGVATPQDPLAVEISHNQRITKTAAQQTLKELRQLALQLQSLSNYVHEEMRARHSERHEVDHFLFRQHRSAVPVPGARQGGPDELPSQGSGKRPASMHV